MAFRASHLAVAALVALTSLPASAIAALDPSAFVGRWTDNGDCGEVTELQADGIFIAPNGAIGNWAVEGDILKIWGPGGTISWTVEFDGPDTIVLTSSDGSVSRSTRCPDQAALRSMTAIVTA